MLLFHGNLLMHCSQHMLHICWYIIWNIYSFITCNHRIANSIFTTTCSRIPNITFFTCIAFFWFLHSHRHLPLFRFWSELHLLPSNLHFDSHDICFVNIFDLFIPYHIKDTQYKSSLLFGTHTLLDRSLRVLQLLRHLS